MQQSKIADVKNSRYSLDKIFLLLLSFESLPFLGAIAKTTPLVYFFVLLFLPFYTRPLKLTPILKGLILYLFFATVVTVIYFIVELFKGDSEVLTLRALNFLRQFSAYSLGLMLFIILRKIFLKLDYEIVLRYCIYAIIPISIFSFLIDIPFFIVDPNEYRIQSYFSEPSHLCEYLVQIIFASIYIYLGLPNRKLSKSKLALFFILGLILMALTSSTTGFIRFFLLLIGIILFENNKYLKIAFFFFMFFLCVGGFYYYTQIADTYLARVLTDLQDSKDDIASFVDRFYSFIGPISHLFISKVSIGYGLGGDTIYYKEFYPNEFIEIVKLVKDGGFNIVSFWGKILVYTGFIGIIIWIVIIIKALRIIKNEIPFNKIAAVLFSIFIHGFIGSGAFLFVHTWFWLAFIDSIYIRNKLTKKVIITPNIN